MEAKAIQSAIKPNRYAIRLQKGEEIISHITQFARDKKIGLASLQFIGAVTDVEMGTYDLKLKDYHKKAFNDNYELLSALGNIALVDGDPFVHLHVTLGDHAFNATGGHLFSATVTATTEGFLDVFPATVERRLNTDIGLKLWDLSTCKIK